MKIALCGSSGKMGKIVAKTAVEASHAIVAEIGRSTDLENCISQMPDVFIDFSSPVGTIAVCQLAAGLKIPVLIGTTGLSDGDREKIVECARNIPILMASNFSIGVHVARKLVREAAERLPSYFDIEIVEKHHSKKKDAPSGTALSMLADVSECRKNVSATFGRHGKCERIPEEICVHAVRGGDTCGEHTVFFFGRGEVIEVTHRAGTREVFAMGAILAAEKFTIVKRPGLYELSDVI
ncbi:MAG: 4-hydroxy-tetrahydrodipicolinate reductase [Puniceicoccales bacterium]|jgi:4-hydroxy-tetrahydrodipicolinate reductase|nr:4-hydroxy-tetrahydrodipicolinate reductase [Puniceicoccales bacterium]